MKKLIITIAAIAGTWTTAVAQHADSSEDLNFKYEALHVSSAMLTTVVIGAAILTFIKWLLDYRLKNKLIEKGAPDHVVSQILQPIISDNKNATIKWFALLMGLGTGLSFIDYYQPLGIHSLAIMSFSLAASFLGYYFYISRREKP
jgi:tellurite resistance protein TehA-like permease